jgi:hypothetical protein
MEKRRGVYYLAPSTGRLLFEQKEGGTQQSLHVVQEQTEGMKCEDTKRNTMRNHHIIQDQGQDYTKESRLYKCLNILRTTTDGPISATYPERYEKEDWRHEKTKGWEKEEIED